LPEAKPHRLADLDLQRGSGGEEVRRCPMEETIGQARQRMALASIEGAAELVHFYGYWPSFHDARVETITIEREGPTVTITFITNDLVVKDGQKQGDRLAKVTLRWYEVEEVDLRATEWGEENWVWDLNLAAHENGLRTELLPNEGIGGSILARRMELLEVQPIEAFPGAR
jgi:Immunity protein 50